MLCGGNSRWRVALREVPIPNNKQYMAGFQPKKNKKSGAEWIGGKGFLVGFERIRGLNAHYVPELVEEATSTELGSPFHHNVIHSTSNRILFPLCYTASRALFDPIFDLPDLILLPADLERVFKRRIRWGWGYSTQIQRQCARPCDMGPRPKTPKRSSYRQTSISRARILFC